jgi:hypothetical protein
MANAFQTWLISQGYCRKNKSSLWIKNKEVVTGKELSNKLNEYKNLKT